MTTVTTDLAGFLLARIAEDEDAAKAAPPAPWRTDDTACCVMHSGHGADRDVAEMTDAGPHIARWDPARVLAECDAKRRIIQRADQWLRTTGWVTGDDQGLRLLRDHYQTTLRDLATPYADHPDYREEWRP